MDRESLTLIRRFLHRIYDRIGAGGGGGWRERRGRFGVVPSIAHVRVFFFAS